MDDHAGLERGQEWTALRPVPRCRSWGDFHIERVGSDVVLFDETTMQYHTLNSAAERIWLACDGVVTVEEIAESTGLPAEVVEITLVELADASLLELPAGSWAAPMARRRAMRLIAAGVVSIPVVLSITAPQPASAASAAYCRGLGYLEMTCTSEWQCQFECPPMSDATCVQVDMTGIGCCKCSNTLPLPPGG